jgi:hypothetical protein
MASAAQPAIIFQIVTNAPEKKTADASSARLPE